MGSACVKLPRKLALDSAHVLLGDEPRPDLLFHGARLLLGPPEQEQPGREPVEPVDRSQVAQIVLLGQDEGHSVVSVSAARMNLHNRRFVQFSKAMFELDARERALCRRGHGLEMRCKSGATIHTFSAIKHRILLRSCSFH